MHVIPAPHTGIDSEGGSFTWTFLNRLVKPFSRVIREYGMMPDCSLDVILITGANLSILFRSHNGQLDHFFNWDHLPPTALRLTR